MDARTDRSLVVIGSGPGIGRHVASSFAIKRFNKVALVARTASSLAADQAAVEAAAAGKVTVKTYQVDITEGEQFAKALNKIGQELGTPECVLFNAATIVPTKLLGIEEDQMLYDFKVSILYENRERPLTSC